MHAAVAPPPDMPLVSVVMPFKDSGDFLEQAARSVLAQTWPALELILVDDGGTDGGRDVAERVRASDPERVRLVEHPGRVNRGIGASRRLGFGEARGELLANLDADDVWEVGHLEHEVRLLLRSPGADIVHGRPWIWFSWDQPDRDDWLFQPPFAPGAVVPGQRVIEALLRHGGYAAPPLCVLFRASLLGAWTEVLDAFPGMYEDQVLHCSLYLRASVVVSGGATAWYRQHDRSVSAGKLDGHPASRFDRGRERFLDWLHDQPLLTDPAARAQLDRHRAALAERAARAGSPIGRAQHVLATRGGRPAATLRRSAGALVDRCASVPAAGRRRLRGGGDPALPARLQVWLRRQGADVRGSVLLLGDPGLVPVAVSGLAEQVRPLPELPSTPGPDHPLAALPPSAYDCIVAVDAAGRDWTGPDLRHLRRTLRPGGVLLMATARPQSGVEARMREAFGADAVAPHWHATPGPRRRPLLGLRAVVAAGPA